MGKLAEVLPVLYIQAGQQDHCILVVQEVPYIPEFRDFLDIQEVPSFQVDLALVVVEVEDSIVVVLVDIHRRTCLGSRYVWQYLHFLLLLQFLLFFHDEHMIQLLFSHMLKHKRLRHTQLLCVNPSWLRSCS